jgi:hypothetical protein
MTDNELREKVSVKKLQLDAVRWLMNASVEGVLTNSYRLVRKGDYLNVTLNGARVFRARTLFDAEAMVVDQEAYDLRRLKPPE